MTFYAPDRFHVYWDEEADQWLGKCDGHHLLSHYDHSPNSALRGIQKLVAAAEKDKKK